MVKAAPDTADPAVRASRRLASVERRHRFARFAVGLLLGVLACAVPGAAVPLPGDGATVGAVIGALWLAGGAVVVWPWSWSAAERRHHELAAIWDVSRVDAAERVPWDRYAAWARVDDVRVTLDLVRCSGSDDTPSPFSIETVRRLAADDVGEAATAMEELRGRARSLESQARSAHLEALGAAERRAHDVALARVDRSAEEHRREAEARMRRELAEQEADEQRAQAEAVARALRRG